MLEPTKPDLGRALVLSMEHQPQLMKPARSAARTVAVMVLVPVAEPRTEAVAALAEPPWTSIEPAEPGVIEVIWTWRPPDDALMSAVENKPDTVGALNQSTTLAVVRGTRRISSFSQSLLLTREAVMVFLNSKL